MMTAVPDTLTRAPDGPHWTSAAPARFGLDDFDYTEEEWIVAGQEGGNDYATILIVRRPADPSRLSGTVVVEPLHFSGITPIWVYCAPYIMRSGHTWTMVACQKGATEEHVMAQDPARYGHLHIQGPAAEVSPPPGISSDPTLQEAFWTDMVARNRACSNILAQTGSAIRAGMGPFGGAHHLVLAGHSQTGFAVTNYIRDAQREQGDGDGLPVYDGYFPSGFPSIPFRDVGVPVVQVISDGDVSNPERSFTLGYDHRAYRRDDSDDPVDQFRLYELAGVPHMGTRYSPYNSADLWAEQAKPLIRSDMHMNSLPHNELFNVGLHHLIEWAVNKTPPPRAERIATMPTGSFAKDEHGNSIGGLRCAQMDVARKRYFSNAPLVDGSLATSSVGIEEAFTPAEFAATYRDEFDYRSRFESRVSELVAEGWLLADDAVYMRDDLESAP